ncbi:MAG: holin family protein [Chlorobiales bacterium]|nr:holin family protein [Chlorobiales bacterium]
MSWITALPLIGDLYRIVFGSELKRDEYQADARNSVYQQFANEFGHGQTWWDSFIDGINRLPRPFMTFGTIYLFWLCWTDPVAFVEGAQALQAMPKEGWYILGAIVTFWFAAKLPKDFGKYKAKIDVADLKKTLKKDRVVTKVKDDPQEGLSWGERVEKRYKTDWDNLND